MNIYFDGTLIDNDYVTGLNFDGKLYNDNEIFILGATICNNVKLIVSKDLAIQPTTNIEITNLGVFNIDNIEENNTSYVYTLVDNMVNFNFRYDAQPLIEASQHVEQDGTKYVLLSELVEDICDKAGTTLITTNFVGKDKHITWYDNTITAREYISMVAELNSGYAVDINGLYIKQYTNTPTETLLLEDCSYYKIGEKHTITRVAMENGLFAPVGTDAGTTIYLNPNNVFITEQQDINNIYNIINGYEFYSIEAKMGNIIINTNQIGNCIAFSDGINTYKTYKQINATYNGGWNGKYHFVIGSIKKEETASYNGVEDNYKRLKLQVDRDKNEIGLLAETKLDSDDYTKAEIIARINDNTSQVQIDADNIDLTGKTIDLTAENIVIDSTNFQVTADGEIISKAGKIANFSINDDGFTQSFYAKYNYTQSDLTRIQGIILGTITPTDEDYEKYDFDEDGEIKLVDYVKVSKFVIFGITPTNPMNIKIKNGSNVAENAIVFSVGSGTSEQIITKLCLDSIQIPRADIEVLSAKNIQYGIVSITPVANTPTREHVDFDEPFSSIPVVTATAESAVIGSTVRGVSVANVTTTGFDVYIYRTNNTNTNINWIAMN